MSAAKTNAATKPPPARNAEVARRPLSGTRTATSRQAPATASSASDGEIANQTTGGRVTSAAMEHPLRDRGRPGREEEEEADQRDDDCELGGPQVEGGIRHRGPLRAVQHR